MKKLFFTAAFLVFSSPAFACDEFDQAMDALEQTTNAPARSGPQTQHAVFTQEFLRKEDLERWTAGSTSGGGHARETELAGKKLFLSFRGYTSGIKSSDAAVYMEQGGTWKLVKSLAPVFNTWIVPENTGDRLILRREDNGETLLVLTAHDLTG